MRTRKTPPFVLALLTLTVPSSACSHEEDEALTGDRDILAVGDSLLGFHYPGDSIPDVAARALDLTMESAARGGETLLGGEDNAIPNQYQTGSYRLLIASGGGNDLGERCVCGEDCGPTLDLLIDEDSQTGAIPDLVATAVEDGLDVAWLGYMVPRADAEEFANCGGELDTLRERLAQLERSEDRLVFVDGALLGSGVEAELYEEDGYHPSVAGSEALGLAIADAVEAKGWAP